MHRFASWSRVLLALLWTGLLAVPVLPVLLLLLPSRRARIVVSAWYGRALGFGCLRIFGMRPEVEGGQHLHASGRVICTSNHSSNLDPFLAFQLNPIGGVGVAKRELAYIPIFGQMYFLSGHLLIDRSNAASAIARLADTAALVRRHRLGLYIWPEGTMPHDGRLLPFKKGVVHLAIATGLPIVPIVVHDAHLRWPARTLDVRPGVVRVQVLPPIPTEGWTQERAQEHADALHDVFAAALAPHQRPGRL